MSHHDIDPTELKSLREMSSLFDELDNYQRKIKGTYPDDKLTPSDQGALSIAISEMGGKVIMAFGEPTAWIGFDPDQAAEIGLLMIKRAREAGLSQPLTIEI